MVLQDSNIVIYLADTRRYPEARDYVRQHVYCVSALSIVEVLGCQRITPEQEQDLRQILNGGETIWLSETIVNRAVELRRERRMSLADAIIAATALVGGISLVSRNTEDFKGISGLTIINPFEMSAESA